MRIDANTAMQAIGFFSLFFRKKKIRNLLGGVAELVYEYDKLKELHGRVKQAASAGQPLQLTAPEVNALGDVLNVIDPLRESIQRLKR